MQETHLKFGMLHRVSLANDSITTLINAKFVSAIEIRVAASIEFKNPSNEEVFRLLDIMGYQEKLKGVVDFKKGKLPVAWLIHLSLHHQMSIRNNKKNIQDEQTIYKYSLKHQHW